MKNLKKLSYIIFPVLLVACSTGLKQEPTDRYPFKEKMKEVFGPNVKFQDAINKYEAQLSNIDFPKNSLKINEIISLLEKDGWVLKGKGVGVDTYCLDENNRINIVTANSGPVINYQGTKLNREDSSENGIAFMYLISGVDSCN